jgi:23S rRNA (uracil1939-C5)-methyltransferase
MKDGYIVDNHTVEKNMEYTIDIVSMGYEGEGVGKLDGFPIFVQGALPGERVRVKIVKTSKGHAFGKLLEIIEGSGHRTEPICGIYKRCGGCQLQHLSYSEQLNFKTDRVKDCMERIGKLEEFIIHPTIGMTEPYRYRNKVQLPVGEKNGEIQIGFYAPRSHDIIDMSVCHIQDEVADKVVRLTRQWMKDYNIMPYDANQDKGIIRHIMIRRGFVTGEVMVVLVTRGEKLAHRDSFIELIRGNIEGIKSIIQNINNKNTNVILGFENKTLYGSGTISDYIGKFKFNISPLSFFQVNPVQTQILYEKALEYANLTGEETVFDAYCGTGTITLFLSQRAKKVYGVEIIPEAIENAIENARVNKVENVEFLVGKSEEMIPDLVKKGVKADVVVVDPPRKGCERSLLDTISEMNPRRIVYVSCDPSTLARDLSILESYGYRTKEVQPVDMFPHTSHVEAVALIEKLL